MDYTICVAKTKALISCAVTVADLLICSFALAYAKYRFSHGAAQYMVHFFYLVKVLIGFNCVWRFIRVVLHVGSGCQSNIKADCLNLLSRPAPVMTIVEIL